MVKSKITQIAKEEKNTAREEKKKKKIKRIHLYRQPDLHKREFDSLSESIQKRILQLCS
jgi:ribosomal protein S10